MASDEENLPADEKIRRSVARTIGNGLLALALLAGLGFWGALGFYTLEPGRAAVLLFLGEHSETVITPGWHLTLPPPLMTYEKVNFSEVRNEDFGFRGAEGEETDPNEILEATMQTSDNNIVRVNYAVQFSIKDAFNSRFSVAALDGVVRDASQAAMREVVGRMTVDGVLRERRGVLASEVEELLQRVLDSYDSGIEIRRVLLQDVQPPAPVRTAFDDVVAAKQDASRLVNEAEGYRNEVIPRARGEAAEIEASAGAYRDSKVALASGESQRFSALLAEYQKAPEVTRKRLYLETMELVLPSVEMVIIEPGTANVLPYLPLGAARGGSPQ